ncbi:MAG: hypothetical protein Q4C46_07055 [Bacillota bacterium]|nr:hypothetical protein [Bacillota bacterium]
MADIKVQEVSKGTIKTIDRSIASSRRIRNVASEIKTQTGAHQSCHDAGVRGQRQRTDAILKMWNMC